MERKNFESEEGQSLILIALMMVAMVGMLGLALDGGRAFAARRASQNAADSAAFGAVRLLATKSVTATEPMIWDTISKFAKANDVVTTTDILAYFIDPSAKNICRIPNCGGIPANATGVRVTTTLQLQPYFIDVLIGKQKIPIPAVAAAQSGPPAVGSEIAPMTVKPLCDDLTNPSCLYQYDQLVRLWGDTTAGGSFQWLDFNVSGHCQLEDYIAKLCTSGPILADRNDTYYPYSSPEPSPSPWIANNTGKQTEVKVRNALDCWIDGTNCLTGQQVPTNRLWIVPIFNHTNGATGGNTLMYHTALFAEFDFQGYWFDQTHCNWVGKLRSSSCDNKPAGSLSSDLVPCLNAENPSNPSQRGQKCLIGYFKREVINLELAPGKCNTNGLDICGIGMSQ